MPLVTGPINPSLPLDINFHGLDTHVYAYTLWWRDPGGDWVNIGTGGTGASNHFQHAVVANSQLYYTVNVGTLAGQPMGQPYSAAFTLSQGGPTVGNGTVVVGGTTTASGVATQDDWVNFV